jgi:hypothetical protein
MEEKYPIISKNFTKSYANWRDIFYYIFDTMGILIAWIKYSNLNIIQ